MSEPTILETQEAYIAKCMASPEMAQYSEAERRVKCQVMYDVKGTSNQTAKAPAYDMQHKIGFDRYTLEDKIVYEDNAVLTMPAIIASEIVHQYDDGWAYKPAEELEKMAAVANRIGSVPVKILEHPRADTNYLLLKHNDVHGKASNFQFVKNLTDVKTKRPCRRGVKADVTWFKDITPPDVIEKIKAGTLRDNSIGFTFDYEPASGEFEGVHYDYVQRNIFLNHVAAPIEAGRCPGPICGIGYDASQIRIDAKIMVDCPVCSHMKEVGWNVAGKRLYEAYGPDVIEVIDTGYKPEVPVIATSLDEEFKAILELGKCLEKTIS